MYKLDWQVGAALELTSTNFTSSAKSIILLEQFQNKMALKIILVYETLDSENDDVVEDSSII